MLPVLWHPKALAKIRSFPEEVKDKIGYLIFRLQLGEKLNMPHSRNIETVAMGVKELRAKGKDGIYRSFYIKTKEEKILIFHAFQKKEQKTSQRDINLAKKNLKEALEWQKQK